MKEEQKGFFDPIVDFLQSVPKPVLDGLKIVGILVLAFVIARVGNVLIKKFLGRRSLFKVEIDKKKLDTMASLMVSVFKYAVYILAGVIILTDVFKMTSVIAAAGVGGIAIGLGAQSLIKDIISGIFIVMEDHYGVGDLVTIEGMNGTVEEMELRITKLRNNNGDLYIIPNGEIRKVMNHTRGNKAVSVDIPLAYYSDTEKAFKVAEEVCNEALEAFDTWTDKPKVLGITEMSREGVTLRIFARTAPNTQWEIERYIRKKIKEAFNKEGIAFFDRDKVISSSGTE